MSDATFLLFLAGSHELKSKRVINNLKENLKNIDYNLTIIDILNNPHVAEQVGIIATPFLVRTQPGPTRRFIGDFSNSEKDFLI
ncbi:MAG: circadian clock protein KaiB [Promethearchaeota archaeon]|nr:MAG: circadian clock protein KaiB [Candidatus Lokiarchaeota archaeon]